MSGFSVEFPGAVLAWVRVVDYRGIELVLNPLVKKSFVLGLVLAVSALSGCALPGYNSGAMDGEHWYGFDQSDRATYDDKLADEQVIDYKPRVIDITPKLLAHQKNERQHEQLDPGVKALAQRPE